MAKQAKRELFVVGCPQAIWGDQNEVCGTNVLVPVTTSGISRLQRTYEEWTGEKGTVYRLTAVKAQAARERRAKGKR